MISTSKLQQDIFVFLQFSKYYKKAGFNVGFFYGTSRRLSWRHRCVTPLYCKPLCGKSLTGNTETHEENGYLVPGT